MSQDDVANIDRIIGVIEATSQERGDNKRKKEDDRVADKNSSKKNRNSTKRKRTFMYIKGKGFVPASYLEGNENNNFSTSTSTNITKQPGPVIEEYILPVSNNRYKVNKSEEEKKSESFHKTYGVHS